MPVSLNTNKSSKTLIDYDEIQKMKGIIEKINNTEILKELKSRK